MMKSSFKPFFSNLCSLSKDQQTSHSQTIIGGQGLHRIA
jgi:hypothetical protein